VPLGKVGGQPATRKTTFVEKGQTAIILLTKITNGPNPTGLSLSPSQAAVEEVDSDGQTPGMATRRGKWVAAEWQAWVTGNDLAD